jgi:TolB-like protein/Flp pilus assembly protein TadD
LSFLNELKQRNVLRVAAAYVVAAWLVIQVVETIFPAFGFGDAAVRIATIVFAVGLIPALVLAWVFEMTPEGLKKESEVDRTQSIPPNTGKKLDRWIMIVLALALGYFAFDKFVLDPARDSAREALVTERARTEALIGSFGQNSLAVLPFVNMSNDVENEYFSDGIAEEVLNLLAKIPDLRVISRSSSFSFRGKDIDIPSIAEQLDVALILEGSVRKYGNQVRITAQLIEARSDTHLWSETYERELKDVFAIQDEISGAIVESLRDSIGLEADDAPTTIATGNTEAHDAYLRGQYLLAQRKVSGAVREFEKAISLDPDYALAHAQLAIAYQLGYLGITLTESVAVAAPHVEKAMLLDPSMAEAHAAAGQLSWSKEENMEALKHFEKAIQINPNYADVYIWMANILDWSMGRYAEAFAMREKSVQLDPLSIPALVNYVGALFYRDRLTEVDRELEKLASLAPNYYALFRANWMSEEGNWADGALALLEALRTNLENRPGGDLAYPLALMGLETEALAVEDDADPGLLRMLGKPRQAVAAAQAALSEDPLSLWKQAAVGLALAGAGDYTGARPYLDELWQRYGIVFMGPRFNVDHATALIAARRATGEEDNIADLVAAIKNNVRRYKEAGISGTFLTGSPDYENGISSYHAGEEQRGLAVIARAVEDGYFIPPSAAYLQDLYEHPGFAAIRAKQEARQAREREKFLVVVCSNNPFATIWQPAGGTCEGFAAKDGN